MTKPTSFKEQSQDQPGDEHQMHPEPEIIRDDYKGSDKLQGKVAIITGGDSGIGRSVAIHFAREGANIVIVYLEEQKDAEDTKRMVEDEGGDCLLIKGDVGESSFCDDVIQKTVKQYGQIDILVNNAAMQFPEDRLEDIKIENLHRTFETNIYAYFYLSKAALPHLSKGNCIINTTSVTAYRGSDHLIDYASTKGAIVSFTRSLAKNVAKRQIRVNAVAPGPIWTPLIPATFDDISDFGQDTPMGRAGQPSDVGPAYVFLASSDSSYMTGQVIHINGGEVVGG